MQNGCVHGSATGLPAAVASELTPTIHDVARVAGVSSATVSRSFNSPQLVNVTTRERVLSAARQLRYLPNPAARGLITGRTCNIGVLVPDLTNPVFPLIVQSAEARLREDGYSTFLADSRESSALEGELIQALAKQVDGVIVCSTRMTEAETGKLGGTRLVFLNPPGLGVPHVRIEPAAGLREAAAHLHELGHRRCVYLSGPRRSWSNRRRIQVLQGAARRLGLDLSVTAPFSPSYSSGEEMADAVLAAGATAAVAFNDLMAIGLVNALRRRGVAVPDEVSVIGNDDVPIAAMFAPALTTVAQPLAEAGRELVESMLALLSPSGSPAEPRPPLTTSLVVRESTAPAPARAGTGRAGPRRERRQGSGRAQ